MTNYTQRHYEFGGFSVNLIPESPQTPMQIDIRLAAMTIDLPCQAAFHCQAVDSEADTYNVYCKMDNSTTSPPEIHFLMTSEELDKLKAVSVLPVLFE